MRSGGAPGGRIRDNVWHIAKHAIRAPLPPPTLAKIRCARRGLSGPHRNRRPHLPCMVTIMRCVGAIRLARPRPQACRPLSCILQVIMPAAHPSLPTTTMRPIRIHWLSLWATAIYTG